MTSLHPSLCLDRAEADLHNVVMQIMATRRRHLLKDHQIPWQQL